MKDRIDRFIQKLNKLNITVSDEQINQFVSYYYMIAEKNKVMNLTSIVDPDEVIDKHFVDSLAITRVMKITKNCNVIDVGTGAGFPGIPLKIVFPEINIVLLDSLNKRIVFLEEVVDKLGLENVKCVHGRSEDMARKKEYREQFDLCVSRAVANLSSLSELCIPFVKAGGTFISYKAGNCGEEIRAAENAVGKLGGKVGQIVEFSLPDTDLKRVFVEIKKVKETPGKYPRKAGTPVRDPIG